VAIIKLFDHCYGLLFVFLALQPIAVVRGLEL